MENKELCDLDYVIIGNNQTKHATTKSQNAQWTEGELLQRATVQRCSKGTTSRMAKTAKDTEITRI